jgi:hypothetical protein
MLLEMKNKGKTKLGKEGRYMPDKVIILSDGAEVKVPEDFAANDRNLIKILLIGEQLTEGIWAWLYHGSIDTYRSDAVSDDYHIVLTANNALNGVPYGCFIPVKMQAKRRPICKMDWLDLDSKPCSGLELLNE